MKIITRNSVHLMVATLLSTVFITGVEAQSKKQESAAIKYAKNVLVSKIETGMPRERFDTWFRRTVGSGMKIKWEVNDCGEQTGSPADKGRDFPMCVEVVAESLDLYVSVVLGVGTFNRGIVGPNPDIRGLSVSVHGEGAIEVLTLGGLEKKLGEIMGK